MTASKSSLIVRPLISVDMHKYFRAIVARKNISLTLQ